MRRVTLNLEDDLEEKMAIAAKSAQMSKSKWVSQLIKEKVVNEWPESINDLAGAWQDTLTLEEIRSGAGRDAVRIT